MSACKILVVEDNPEQREMLKELLELDSHHVDLAGSKEQAKTLFETNEYSLVMSDCDLPHHGEGIKLLQQLTAFCIGCNRPIPAKILMSGRHDRLFLNAASAGSAPLYKPYNIHSLNAAISQSVRISQTESQPLVV